jgi:hypothetical protein
MKFRQCWVQNMARVRCNLSDGTKRCSLAIYLQVYGINALSVQVIHELDEVVEGGDRSVHA